MQEIDGYMEQQIQRVETVVERTLSYAGEVCINAARAAGDYRDQTGNLRSSIGYVVSKNGAIVQSSDFAAVKQGGKGSSEGEQFAKAQTAPRRRSIALVAVAGMDYSAQVAARGRDVLDTAETIAGELIPRLLRKI